MKASNKKDRYEKSTTIYDLCSDVPNEIYLFLIHVRNLQYEESPDYAYLESLFEEGLKRRGYKDDGIFDWTVNTKE